VGRRKRLHNIGVKLREMNPEIKMATLIVTANSLNNFPTMPGRSKTGINTATSDSVMLKIVNPISADPS